MQESTWREFRLSDWIVKNFLKSKNFLYSLSSLFKKDQDDQKLEEVREYQLTRRVIIIQKTFRLAKLP